MRRGLLMKEIIEKRTGLKLKGLPKKVGKYGGHEVGKTYFCGYWRQTYTVIEAKEGGCFGWSVVCKWQDGGINSHSTSLKPGKDFEVVTA
jgi:hypothetical protein